jgi:hypothetical protein
VNNALYKFSAVNFTPLNNKRRLGGITFDPAKAFECDCMDNALFLSKQAFRGFKLQPGSGLNIVMTENRKKEIP